MRKLEGLSVLDLTQFLPGPICTQFLAEHGARVIKIESPNGDPARLAAPFENETSIWFANSNRCKEFETIDLKSEAGKSRLTELISQSDVLVEGFKPGTMAKLGFDYHKASIINPRLVYCSISAFGQNGPLSTHPAHDMAVQAFTGFLSLNDDRDGNIAVPGVPSADLAAGMTALSAILMGIIGREKTGKGDYIDCSMYESLMTWSVHLIGNAIKGGEPPQSKFQRSVGGAAFYNCYKTSDNKYIALAGREAKFARNFLEIVERLDLYEIAISENPEDQKAVINYFDVLFSTKSQIEWLELLERSEIAFAPVLDFRDAINHEHAKHCGLVRQKYGNHYLSSAIKFLSENSAHLEEKQST